VGDLLDQGLAGGDPQPAAHQVELQHLQMQQHGTLPVAVRHKAIQIRQVHPLVEQLQQAPDRPRPGGGGQARERQGNRRIGLRPTDQITAQARHGPRQQRRHVDGTELLQGPLAQRRQLQPRTPAERPVRRQDHPLPIGQGRWPLNPLQQALDRSGPWLPCLDGAAHHRCSAVWGQRPAPDRRKPLIINGCGDRTGRRCGPASR